MKGLLVTAVTAGVVVGAAWILDATNGPHGTAPGEAPGEVPLAPPTVSLREQVLHTTADKAGVAPIRRVWGVVMERGYAKGTASVIALADGTASLSLSTGGLVTGGKAYPPAHAAALKLCEQAADSLSETSAAHDFPWPAKGRVRFYVLAVDGVRVAESDIVANRADRDHDPLAPLRAAGEAVLDALKDGTNKGLLR